MEPAQFKVFRVSSLGKWIRVFILTLAMTVIAVNLYRIANILQQADVGILILKDSEQNAEID